MSERAEFFNNIASDPRYKYKQILEDIAIKNGNFILDYGCGGGFFSYSFSSLVGSKGKVFASDINTDFLRYVEIKSKEKNLLNIRTVHIDDLQTYLIDGMLDIIFFRNVIHHISNRVKPFKKIKNYLKENGRIFIIDYTPEGNKMGYGPPGHYVNVQDLIYDMEKAGYALLETKEYLLPAQSFSVFIKS